MKLYHAAVFTVLALAASASVQAAEIQPFLGLQGGYDYLRAPAPETEKEGYNLGVKFVPSFEMKRFYIDPAIGYQKEVIEGEGRKIDTQSAFGELSLRIKLNDYWSFGPMGKLHFGIDNRRMEGPDQDDSTLAQMGGDLVYQGRDGKGRWQLQALSSSGGTGYSRGLTSGDDNRDRRLTSVILGFQINMFGPQKPKTVERIVEKPVIVEVEKTVVVEKEVVQEAPSLVMNLDGNAVKFKTNSADLDAGSARRLKKIGEYLSSENIKIQKIKVGGHTDSRGSREYNQSLSERRAASVQRALKDAGVTAPIEAEGYNFSRPVAEGNNEAAWSQNRRTEIEFYGLEAPEALRESINTILKK